MINTTPLVLPLAIRVAPTALHSDLISQIAGKLDDVPMAPKGALVGVDIGHVRNMPGGPAVSEIAVAFAAHDGKCVATIGRFLNDGAASSLTVMGQFLKARPMISKTVHQVLDWNQPQINTLIFRDFTIVYSCDYSLREPQRATSLSATLMLHDRESALSAAKMVNIVDLCLEEFHATNDEYHSVRLITPTPKDILAACG